MEDDPQKLKKRIKALSARTDDGFLELGRALRRLQEIDPKSFREAMAAPEIGRRLGYYLVAISAAFDGLPVSDARLDALGWTKLQVLAPHVTADNVGELVELAEQNTAFELEGLVKELPREEERCVLLRMTEADYGLFTRTMRAYGAVKSGRGLANKEAALRKLLAAAVSVAKKTKKS
jgi:hypothetical protein